MEAENNPVKPSRNYCYYCVYFSRPRKNSGLKDYWCYRWDLRVLKNTPICDAFKLNMGKPGVDAPYMGLIKREEEMKKEATDKNLLAILLIILGVLLGVILYIY